MGKKAEFLVGYTGFVGSNLDSSHAFDGRFNTKNIEQAYGGNPDLLVYAGVRAEKFLANSDPDADMENIKKAMENIAKIGPAKIVLISTVDVYRDPNGADEDSEIETDGLHPYGLNRYRLEQWVEDNFSERLIVRLPALYGKNIKKNFIYDMINIIPSMLNESKFSELSQKNSFLREFYLRQDNGFYKCRELSADEREELKRRFLAMGFSALNFTDSRGVYQFYNLGELWNHMVAADKLGIKKLNLATQGVSAGELYRYITGREFVNELNRPAPFYDFRTKYSGEFGGGGGYIFDRDHVLADIKSFVERYI